MADVFISYKSQDRDTARRLREELVSREFDVWWDDDLYVGRLYPEQIEQELRAARCVIVIWSGLAVDSNWVRSEATSGMDRLVPVRIDDASLPLEFSLLQTIDLRKPEALDDCVAAVRAVLERPPVPPAPPPPHRKPRRALLFVAFAALGLAPILITPLFDLYPRDLRTWLIPLSAVVMGMTAAVVRFESASHRVDHWFKRIILVFVCSLVALLVAYVIGVARVESFAYTTGAMTVPYQPPGSTCECLAGEPAAECLHASLDPDNISHCFGTLRILTARILLALLYFTVTCTMTAGIVLYRQQGIIHHG